MASLRSVVLRIACACVATLLACTDGASDDRAANRGDTDAALRLADASTTSPPRVTEDAAAPDKPAKPEAEPTGSDAASAQSDAATDEDDDDEPVDAAIPSRPTDPGTVPDSTSPADDGGTPDAGDAQDASLDAAEPDAPIDPELAALIAWVIETLNEDRPPTTAELTARFTPEFLADIPPAELAATFDSLGDTLRPLTETARTVRGLAGVIELASPAGKILLEIGVTSTTPRKIGYLYVQETPPPLDTDGYDGVIAALQPLAARTQLLVARVSADGQCRPIVEHAPGERLAIGSAFKLWVLLAVGQKLDDDPSASWTTRLPIRDELKSLPSGVLQNQPAGTLLTLDEYASKMIEISDNTATDHLIEYVGRTAVEAIQSVTHHSNPDANIPWLTTRELFRLKLAISEAERDAYRAASVPERRALLEQYRTLPLDPTSLGPVTEPIALDLEWFATPLDLCNVLATLGARASFSPTSQSLQILGLNPGANFDSVRWNYAGYKGGSEVGVLNLSWLLQRADGEWFSVIVTLNDPERAIDERAAFNAAASLFALVAAESGP